jgi:hypothetical protein
VSSAEPGLKAAMSAGLGQIKRRRRLAKYNRTLCCGDFRDGRETRLRAKHDPEQAEPQRLQSPAGFCVTVQKTAMLGTRRIDQPLPPQATGLGGRSWSGK